MLQGQELLAKVKELGTAPKEEIAKACGYVSQGHPRGERVKLTAFYSALLEAKGVVMDADSGNRKAGRKVSHRTKVHFNGNLMVGKAYMDQLGFQPGDRFEIRLSKNRVTLTPLSSSEE